MADYVYHQLESAGLPFTPTYNECNSDQDVGVCNPNKGNGCNGRWEAARSIRCTHTVTYFTPIQAMTTNWTSYGAWARPCAGTLGDAGPDGLYGPRSFTTDASIMKNFSLTERFTLQFRMDAFNLFNHRVLGFNSNQGNTCIDCVGTNAGQVTDIESDTMMRALEFALEVPVLSRSGTHGGWDNCHPLFFCCERGRVVQLQKAEADGFR